MSSNVKLGIQLKLDGSGQFVGEVTAAEHVVKRFGQATARSLDDASAATARLGDSLGRVGQLAAGAFAALQLGQGLGDVLRLADAYASLEARLRVASAGFGNAAQAQEAIFRIANAARVDVASLAETYGQLARGAGEAGVTQQRLVGITETLAKAVALSGGSAESARAALTQLSQGLASGTLRGEELNSVLEQTPVVARAIADGLGLPIGALREYAAQGKLTADQVLQALERSKDRIEQQFTELPQTIGGALTQLRNNLLQTVGDIDKASQSSSLVADVIGVAASNTNLLAAAGAALAAAGIAGTLAGIATSARAASLAIALAGAAANPFVGIPVLLATAGAAWWTYSSSVEGAEQRATKAAQDGATDQIAALNAVLQKLRERNAAAAAPAAESLLPGQREMQQAGAAYAQLFGEFQRAQERGDPQAVVVEFGKRVGRAWAVYSQIVSEGTRATGDEVGRRFDEFSKRYRSSSDKAADEIAEANRLFRGKVDDKALDALIDRMRSGNKSAPAPRTAAARLDPQEAAGADLARRLAGQIVQLEEEARARTEGTAAVLRQQAAYAGLTDTLGPYIDRISELRQANQLQSDQDEFMRGLGDRAGKIQEETLAREQGVGALLRQRAALLGLSDASEAYIQLVEQSIEVERERAALDDRRQFMVGLSEQVRALADERTERELGIGAVLRQRAALLGLSDVSEQYIQIIERGADEARMKKTWDDISSGLTDSLFRAAESGKSIFVALRDSIKGMFNNLVLKPFLETGFKAGFDWLSTAAKAFLFAADGAAFGPGGQITAFANGGVVTRPTAFRFSGGTGLMGEAGPEAIMPLRRGPDGKLGVMAQGGGGGVVVNQSFTFHGATSRSEAYQIVKAAEQQTLATLRDANRRGNDAILGR